MRLPGTRYQEYGWEQVRKLLGRCSLLAFDAAGVAGLLEPAQQAVQLDVYTDAMGDLLRHSGARELVSANSYGESVQELALSLVYELQAHPSFWAAMVNACILEHAKLGAFWLGPSGPAMLRKKVNDMYAGLRDKVDADNYQVACGRACSPNKIYAYRMLDTAYSDIARLFGAWQTHTAQVAEIVGHPLAGMPIEARQMKSIGACKAHWIIRWSASREQFDGSPGPLHTRSKRFANLKDNPDKIAAMLGEIAEYEQLSANQDHDWANDASVADTWIDDYWRVLAEAETSDDGAGADRILAAPDDEFADAALPDEAPAIAPWSDPDPQLTQQVAERVSLPPRFVEMAWAAQDGASWSVRTLHAESLAVRLAVYLKLMGAFDDSYPDQWCDPATGALPTMLQLAGLDQISLPTLRKRRNEAIVKLRAATPHTGEHLETTR